MASLMTRQKFEIWLSFDGLHDRLRLCKFSGSSPNYYFEAPKISFQVFDERLFL